MTSKDVSNKEFTGADPSEKQNKESENSINLTVDSIDSIDDLLPPSKLYTKKGGADDHSNIDADLDAMLEIDMEDVAILKRKEMAKSKRRIMNRKTPASCINCRCVKIGNTTIWNRTLYQRFQWGIIGPHGFGVFCTMGLLYFASYYFIQKAYNDIGIVSSGICVWLTFQATVFLFLVCFRDPGIVWDANKYQEEFAMEMPETATSLAVVLGKNRTRKDTDQDSEFVGLIQSRTSPRGEEEGWRYCGVCEVYQPPKAMHCPDCNVCVDGYDHHCPWMGICIGKNNFKSFVAFNMTWLVYLVYASAWVAGIGPHYFNSSSYQNDTNSN
jgi:Uncharacterized protein containing DHHC-type Zn finger